MEGGKGNRGRGGEQEVFNVGVVRLSNLQMLHSSIFTHPTFHLLPPSLPLGYYPRIFYPRLYNVKERMLKNFQPVFNSHPFLPPSSSRLLPPHLLPRPL